MRVSIVVPVHDQEANLEQCVRSILQQTHEDLEVVLVENGSTDRSYALCEALADADPRVITLRLGDSGVSVARNAGVGLATGQCIMFCDSDDSVEPSWVRELHDRLLEGDCGVAVAGYKVLTSNAGMPWSLARRVLPRGNTGWLHIRNLYLLERWRLLNPVWNKIYFRSTIDSLQLRFDPRISNGEDLLFNLNYLSACTKIGLVFDDSYKYRLASGGTLSTTYAAGAWEVERRVREEFRRVLCSSGGWDAYQGEFWGVYLEILENLLSRHAHFGVQVNALQRFRANTAILRSVEAREILSSAGRGERSFFYMGLLRYGNYFWIWVYRVFQSGIRFIHRNMARGRGVWE